MGFYIEHGNSPVKYLKIHFTQDNVECCGYINETVFNNCILTQTPDHPVKWMRYCEVVFDDFNIIKNRINNAVTKNKI